MNFQHTHYSTTDPDSRIAVKPGKRGPPDMALVKSSRAVVLRICIRRLRRRCDAVFRLIRSSNSEALMRTQQPPDSPCHASADNLPMRGHVRYFS